MRCMPPLPPTLTRLLTPPLGPLPHPNIHTSPWASPSPTRSHLPLGLSLTHRTDSAASQGSSGLNSARGGHASHSTRGSFADMSAVAAATISSRGVGGDGGHALSHSHAGQAKRSSMADGSAAAAEQVRYLAPIFTLSSPYLTLFQSLPSNYLGP